MHGLMQDHPLLISSLLTHAAQNHQASGIITGQGDGQVLRHTYPEIATRTARLAHALRRLGIAPGDRVATMAWNDHRHVELYFAISGIGAVCHTINPRLFPGQIRYIIQHARDRLLFIDPTLLPALETVFDEVADVLDAVVVMSDTLPDTGLLDRIALQVHEDLISDEPAEIIWPVFDEKTASSLCYTSGTTGHPKGVLYSHRSTVLHAWSVALPDVGNIRAIDAVLPIVPMFHVNAWGLPYSAALMGATLVMPGPHMDGASLHRLIGDAGVTRAAGVPTVWLNLLQHLRETGGTLPADFHGIVGGSALPQSLARTFLDEFGVHLDHAWGMTEMSPVGAYNAPKPETRGMTEAVYFRDHIKKQGRPPFGVEMKLIDDTGRDLPHDGETRGELCVRGPWITSGYYEAGPDDNNAAFTNDGWFRTGDVVTIDPAGYMHIVDRVKDLIKSGGEWISSIELENLAVSLDGVREAAAIPARHPKWGERPILIVVREPGHPLTEDDMTAAMQEHLSEWMCPDAVIFVDELPHTATGKIQKRQLRKDYADHLVETARQG